MERITLPDPRPLDTTLLEALTARSSSLHESGTAPISLEEIGTLLGAGLGGKEKHRTRHYPSGGALYPIETYLIAVSLADAQPGVYHYDPTAHALERLWDLPEDFSMRRLVGKPHFISPSALLVFTSVWERSTAKYGDFAYTLALLEAGHMSENVLLVAAALGLEVRPMAGFDDQFVTELLDLDERFEQGVHSITLSKSDSTKPDHGPHFDAGSEE